MHLTNLLKVSATTALTISLIDAPGIATTLPSITSQFSRLHSSPPAISGFPSSTNRLVSTNPPPGSGNEGTPKGTRPPGTRPGGVSCRETIPPLTALVEDNGKDFTQLAHPTFWVYIPYNPDEIKSLEFSLHPADLSRTLYRTAIRLTGKPGLIGVPLPIDRPDLQVGELYKWKVAIRCNSSDNEVPIVYDYWVRRVAQSSETVWYDRVTALATQIHQGTTDVQVQQQWQELLHSQQWDSLLSMPFTTYELQPAD
jgi:hypothetical protein